MKISRFKSRFITITLILSFMSIGVAHAESICDGSCKCHLKGSPGKASFSFSASPSGTLPKGVVIHLHQGSQYFAKGDSMDTGCHEGTVKLSCEMETPGDRYALQRSLPAVSVSDNSSKVDPIILGSLIHPIKELAPGPSLRHQVIESRAPAPLYLRHLSVLC
jgi:hypothetical protein